MLLDELDEKALLLLAKRLAPHLGRLDQRNPAIPPVAYTVHSLAAELGVSPKAIRCAIARGELRGVKRGSRWIITADAVSEWAAPSIPRCTSARSCSPRAPKAAGPSLRSVICAGHRGGFR
jgi:excisionase family DNA binding protein